MKKSLTDLMNEYLRDTYEAEQYKDFKKQRTIELILIGIMTVTTAVALLVIFKKFY
jgi:hypothetical protein